MRTFHKNKIRDKYPKVEITLSGNSTPEDAREFYIPFCESIEAFTKAKMGQFTAFKFIFRLDYYNSASAHYITRIMTILKPLVKKGYVEIDWYYFHKDYDIKEQGEDFKDIMNININIIKSKN